MGRSVSVPSNAITVAYRELDDFDADDFDWFIDDVRYQLGTLWPSVVHQDAWAGREDHIIAGNEFAYFGVSEYCGVASLWIIPTGEHENLAYSWIESMRDRFEAEFGTLRKLGTMSNGEGVFQRAETAA